MTCFAMDFHPPKDGLPGQFASLNQPTPWGPLHQPGVFNLELPHLAFAQARTIAMLPCAAIQKSPTEVRFRKCQFQPPQER